LAVVKMRVVNAFNRGQQQTWHGAATDDGERRSSVRSIDNQCGGPAADAVAGLVA